MDLIDFWDYLISKWQDEEKCDLCWADFEAPMFESASNIVQVNEGQQCCVMSMLTNEAYKETPRYASNGLENGITKNISFDIHFVSQGDLGTNNYKEIKGHPKSESRSETIYKPIYNCLNRLEIQEELCLFTGLKVDVILWELINAGQAYLDNNYYGWKLRATFRIET